MAQDLDEKLEKITEKLTEISITVAEQKIILSNQHETLQEHMRRSLANEEAVELMASRLEPVEKHVDRIEFLGKGIGWLLGTGIVGGIIVAAITKHLF